MERTRLPVFAAAFAVLLAAPASAAPITVDPSAGDETSNNGKCSLREAISAANNDNTGPGSDCAAGSGADVITLPAGNYTLTLGRPGTFNGTHEDSNTQGDLDISSDVTINGAGAANTTVDAAHIDRVLDIQSGTVTIRGVSLRSVTCWRVSRS